MHTQAIPAAIDTYSVSLFTQVRVTMHGIKASSPEEAAKIAEESDLDSLVTFNALGAVTDVQFQDVPSSMIGVIPVVGDESLHNLELVLDEAGHADLKALAYLRRLYSAIPKDPTGASLKPFLHMQAGTTQAEAEEWFRNLAPHVQPDGVLVKHWDRYSDDDAGMTHSIVLEDQREATGQLFVTITGDEADQHDTLGVSAEVHTNPIDGTSARPCVHIHFDGNHVALSLFKVGRELLLVPETDVDLTPVQVNLGGLNGKPIMYDCFMVTHPHDECDEDNCAATTTL